MCYAARLWKCVLQIQSSKKYVRYSDIQREIYKKTSVEVSHGVKYELLQFPPIEEIDSK